MNVIELDPEGRVDASHLFSDLRARLFETRALSTALVHPLSAEDQCVQAMDDASPSKWHLAHTTWFFETFLLAPHMGEYQLCDERFGYCFNSYYEAVGARHPRPYRGLLTRPSADEVASYRAYVDDALQRFLDDRDGELSSEIFDIIELGINHEQQHQELLLTDILSLFAANPLRPAYLELTRNDKLREADDLSWLALDGGIVDVGHGGRGFHYDNEAPRHEQLLAPFKLADRLVTNGDWLAFMDDGGYETAGHWLSDGWVTVQQNKWTAPNYWERREGRWHQMTLRGLLPIDKAAPVSHVSYFEADAFARWAGKRLPREGEWETAANGLPIEGNTLGSGHLRPRSLDAKNKTNALRQMFGDVWEWTQSAYLAYPGYRPPSGAVGEYNGKFMCNQFVLKGASCVTADGHSRKTYRNFFYPNQRWQFMGLRLAQDN